MAKKAKKIYYKAPVIDKSPITDNYNNLDYTNVHLLKKFITTRGRILETSRTGVTPKHQRKLAQAIKRARYMALIPYTQYI